MYIKNADVPVHKPSDQQRPTANTISPKQTWQWDTKSIIVKFLGKSAKFSGGSSIAMFHDSHKAKSRSESSHGNDIPILLG